MTTSLIGVVPSAISELGMLANTVSNRTPCRWACDVGNRTYTGGQYADNRALVKFGGDLSLVGRASVPMPMKFFGNTGYSDGPSHANWPYISAVGSAGTGGEVGDVPVGTTRHYRISWAKEQAAIGVLSGGDASKLTNDARHPSQQVPFGMFGPLCSVEDAVSHTTEDNGASPDDSRIGLTITAARISVPADYGITHVYFWASPEEEGIYRYVGKVAYTASGPSYGTLYDTLSDEALGERVQHTDQFLAMPTLSAATRFRSRWVGIVGGQQSRMGTTANKLYLKMTANSRTVDIVDIVGEPPSTSLFISSSAVAPRYWEHGGVLLDIAGDNFRYEVDQVDENDRTRFYLVTPWQGASTGGSTGTAFTAEGANLLAIGYANLQQQEFVAPSMLLRGDDYFGGTLTTCIDTPRGDALLVFTRSSSHAIRGLPEVEAIETGPVGAPDIRPISLTEGAAGPYAVCHGPGNTVFALGDTALYSVSTESVTEMGGEAIRDFLAGLPGEDKERARLVYDSGRRMLYVLLPYLEDWSRPGFSGFDSRELCLVLDLEAGAYTVWNGGRWRACGVCDPTVAATGPQVLFQDNFGDVLVLDDKALVDKLTPGVYGYGGAGNAAFGSGLAFAFADASYTLTDANVRGQYMVADSYTASSSTWVPGVAIEGAQAVEIDVNDDVVVLNGWPAISATAPTPSWGQLGGIVVEWQTGAIEPPDGVKVQHIRSIAMDVEASDTLGQTIVLEAYSAGITGQMPKQAAPTVERCSGVSQLKTMLGQPMPTHSGSRRVGAGFRYLQRSVLGDEGDELRVRINSMDIETGGRNG